jgi:hypothetical protein
MKKILLTLLITLTILPLHTESNWTVEDNEMYVSGNTVHGHKFGYFKDEKWCGKELLFIQWTSYEDGLEKFKGVDVLIELRSNGELIDRIPATFTAGIRFAELMTIAEFKTVLLSSKLANQLKNTQEIEVKFVEPKGFVELLDIKSDIFDTSNFPKVHLQKYNSCKMAIEVVVTINQTTNI